MAYPVTVDLAEKYLPIVDKVFRENSKTSILDAHRVVDFSDTNIVKILKIVTSGLANYTRGDDFKVGNVNAKWEPLQLNIERALQLRLDRFDNEEEFGVLFGEMVGMFLGEHVIPEVDAYRFARYATWSGETGSPLSQSATYTTDTAPQFLSDVDKAMAYMDNNEVPREGRVMFVSSNLTPVINCSVSRSWANDNRLQREISSYNGVPIITVPQSRFYTGITLNDPDGNGAYGFSSDGNPLNFMIIYKGAVQQVTKFAKPKTFNADIVQDADVHKFDFRLYHDAFILDNKIKGLYVNYSEQEEEI